MVLEGPSDCGPTLGPGKVAKEATENFLKGTSGSQLPVGDGGVFFVVVCFLSIPLSLNIRGISDTCSSTECAYFLSLE